MKGQTLIEVLVALGIITIVVTAISAVVVTSQGSSNFSKDQNLATQYAQEGLDITRKIRDSDFMAFKNYANYYCLAKGTNFLDETCVSANIDNYFLRRINIMQSGCGIGSARVQSIVSWQDSKCSFSTPFCHNSTLETCLSTVNPAPGL